MFFAVDGFLTQGTSEKKKKHMKIMFVSSKYILCFFVKYLGRVKFLMYIIYIYIFRMKINIEIKMNHDPAQYKLHV